MEHSETPTAHGRVPKAAWTALIALVLAAAVALAVVAAGADGDADRASVASPLRADPAETVPMSVQIDLHHRGRRVPARFLGLSFEATSLSQIASFGAGGNFVGLLRSLGPGMLRFGGVSADTRIAWTDPLTPRPAWTSHSLEAGDLRRLAALAARSDWRVLLTVGLAHYAPAAAAREMRVAKRALGRSLAGVEIGNEPDAYARHGLRPLPWTAGRYAAEVRAYRRAIGRLTRGIALAAPGVSGSHSFVSWGRAVARSQRPSLLTGHHYPLGCHQIPAPSIERLLSAQTRRLEGTSLARYMAVSRHSRIPLRIDEANSVSCGGHPGISNTFAAALWATDYITQTMAAGAAGINLQGNPGNCLGYSPVCGETPQRLARGIMTPLPVWYALLLSRSLVGDRPLPTSASSPQKPNVAVRTLLARDGSLHVVAVNAEPVSAQPVSLSVRVGSGFGAASVLALSAPSPEATSGVTLGGQPVAPDGSWRRPATLPSAPIRGGVLEVTVPPSSAALVTVTPHG
ncbi:MAG: Ricin lectin [Solirubrobacterales bacterium]|nr:Ricin lectin [Solirubrobacterales bacterium]